jgi:hypothetical protein
MKQLVDKTTVFETTVNEATVDETALMVDKTTDVTKQLIKQLFNEATGQ